MHKAARNLRQLTQSITAILLLLATPTTLHAAEIHAATVIFFADHPMKEEQWFSLFADIPSELQKQGRETSSNAAVFANTRLDLLRGDQIQPGIVVENSISVYLHGDCSQISEAAPRLAHSSTHPEALGWVERSNNQITPFIHIDCGLISRLLRSSALFLSANRDTVTTIAIARVFLHEWLHIKTQNPNHTHTGIAKSTFTADDLAGTTETAHLPKKPRTPSLTLLSPLHGK